MQKLLNDFKRKKQYFLSSVMYGLNVITLSNNHNHFWIWLAWPKKFDHSKHILTRLWLHYTTSTSEKFKYKTQKYIFRYLIDVFSKLEVFNLPSNKNRNSFSEKNNLFMGFLENQFLFNLNSTGSASKMHWTSLEFISLHYFNRFCVSFFSS